MIGTRSVHEFLGAFDERDRDVRLKASKIAHALIITTVPAGACLDWLVYPELFGEFLVWRLLVALLSALILAVHYVPFARRNVHWLGMISPVLVNLMISAMIFRVQGAASPYYAGLNLVMAGIGVLLPWTLGESAIACGITFLAYALACVAHGGLAAQRSAFLANFYFLAITGLICMTAAHFKHRGRLEEFRLSSELARSYEQVSESERLKTEFFANVSHELRTPLTLILSPLGDLLQRAGELPADLVELVGIARDNSLRLLRLVNDLLELSRLEKGDIKLRPERVDLGEFASTQAESVRPLARLKGLELMVHLPHGVLWVSADPTLLEKILMNLLTNAVKFTPQGGRVSVTATLEGTTALVEVADTGIGISEEDLPIIFERFRQADGSSGRRFSGVGLGLSLARELAERLGGTLAARSRLGEGSTFGFRMPLRSSDEAGEAPGPVASSVEADDVLTAHLREANRFVTVGSEESLPVASGEVDAPRDGRATVLVIDDEPDMRRYLAGILEDRYRVLKARDGSEGLELARSVRPALVVVDLMMPGLNGWEVCAELKRNAGEGAPKVVIVTARTDEMAKIAALKQGADDFLSKPFSTLEVRTRLANLAVAHELERSLRLQNVELKDTLAKLRAAEARLVAREKMEAVVRLAGGILHEINNPLNFTLTAVSIALDRVAGRDEMLTGILEDVRLGMVRVKDIVSDLRAFASPGGAALQRESLVFADLLDQALRFTSAELKDVHVRAEVPAGLRIHGSKSQLLQVLTNLLLNAGTALRKNSSEHAPVIVVTARASHAGVTVGVRDNGTGIPQDIIGKVFDPFLTTREVGKGMGLGLSICRAVVSAHGGDIRVRSEEGRYTEVEFDLPYPEKGVAA